MVKFDGRDPGTLLAWPGNVADQTRSSAMAMPWPTPMHMVASA